MPAYDSASIYSQDPGQLQNMQQQNILQMAEPEQLQAILPLLMSVMGMGGAPMGLGVARSGGAQMTPEILQSIMKYMAPGSRGGTASMWQNVGRSRFGNTSMQAQQVPVDSLQQLLQLFGRTQ